MTVTTAAPALPNPRGVPAALSPSRAADFLQCPLLYRFRVVDRLPEPPSPAAVRGTLVHSVLEKLYDLPAAGRSVAAAKDMLGPQWEALRESDPSCAGMLDENAFAEWMADAERLVEAYFTLEDPTRLEPAERELYVETTLDGGLTLRGYVDRLDVAPGGVMRVVDYKTSRSPREAFEAKALFQMKFYALVLWRSRGAVPRMLQLVYLRDGTLLRYEPSEHDLRATERKLLALWQAVRRAAETGDWRPSPSRLCDWCHHRPLCPAFGGTPPPLPDDAAARASGVEAGRAVVPGRDEEE